MCGGCAMTRCSPSSTRFAGVRGSCQDHPRGTPACSAGTSSRRAHLPKPLSAVLHWEGLRRHPTGATSRCWHWEGRKESRAGKESRRAPGREREQKRKESRAGGVLQARERQAKSALKLERREAKSAVMTYLTIIVAPAALHGTPWRVRCV